MEGEGIRMGEEVDLPIQSKFTRVSLWVVHDGRISIGASRKGLDQGEVVVGVD